MAKKKPEVISFIEGQLTIWDIKITEKPAPVTKVAEKITKIEEKVTENKVLFTKMGSSFTELQSKVIEKYKAYPELNRIIQYCGGGVGIELMYEDSYKTIYVNTEGKEEFITPKKSSVLPMDKILYYKSAVLETNNTQEQKLEELRKKVPVKKVIRRKGDENILVEIDGKVISIIPKGWVLEFNECKAVYEADEVLQDPVEEPVDLVELQKSVKIGDVVEASYGSKIITGYICHVYGPDNVTLNIIFDNGTKHTAICRLAVKKVLKSA